MKLSVIIPFYNEEGNIEFVIQEIVSVLATVHCEYEILAFDDASRDRTRAILEELSRKIKALKVAVHQKNFGQGVCLWRGITQATGDVIITMDGDGQNDFHDVIKMLPLLGKFDAVLGQRAKRNDPLSKRVATRIAYFFRRLVLNDTVRDTACALRVMKREVIQCFIPLRSFHLFVPFMLSEAGVPFTTVNVHHRPRTKGKSKYSLRKFYFASNVPDLFFMWRFKKRNVYKFAPFKR